jgi:hypothetical protein
LLIFNKIGLFLLNLLNFFLLTTGSRKNYVACRIIQEKKNFQKKNHKKKIKKKITKKKLKKMNKQTNKKLKKNKFLIDIKINFTSYKKKTNKNKEKETEKEKENEEKKTNLKLNTFLSKIINKKEKISYERKILNIIRFLNTNGYIITCLAYLSPSGCYWRCTLNPQSSNSINYSSSSKGKFFGIENGDKMEISEFSKKLIKQHNIKKRDPNEEEKFFLKWLNSILNLGDNVIYYEFDDGPSSQFLNICNYSGNVKILQFVDAFENFKNNNKYNCWDNFN